MGKQSYIKLWTSKPSEHDEVQVYDLLAFSYELNKPVNKHGEVTGEIMGGNIRIVIGEVTSGELMEWVLNTYQRKDGEIVNSTGKIGSVKEHILLKGAQCIDFRIHGNRSGLQLSLIINVAELNIGGSCYSNHD